MTCNNAITCLSQTPTEILDWTIDWGSRGLGTDVIISSAWAVSPSGLNAAPPPPSFTGTSTTVWLSGGAADDFYTVTNTITTAGGREMQETFVMKIITQRYV